ncbi:MAG: bacillithiol system redox-active protein YtxJ [bacterium]|nr:bacillithiol system redox-active protein YtxJ [bacterium]
MADAQELSRITTLAQLDDLLAASSERLVWIFKHSLICGTSAGAWREFEKFAARQADRTTIGVIEIQRAREVSREVEARTGLRHQSPQVLAIRSGRPVWHASHWEITERALDEAEEIHAELETANQA